jgi:hypothetical protein
LASLFGVTVDKDQSTILVPSRQAGSFLKIFKSGNLVYLTGSEDGKVAAPEALVLQLASQLRYKHRRMLYGREAYTSDGKKRSVEVTEKRLYTMDSGRLITSFGFIRRVLESAASLGLQVSYCDIDSQRLIDTPHPRPDRYVSDWANVRRCFSFRARQEDCLKAIESSPWGLVDATMGFGKMAIMVMVCLLFPRAKIHIITKRCPIVIKIANYLTKYIPNVGQVGCGSKVVGDRITVFSADSLERSDFECDILLIDEVHEPVTDAYLPLLARYSTARRYGFTGTSSGRTDGADIRMEAIVGPPIFRLGYQEAQSLGLVVPIVVEWTDVDLSFNPAAGRKDNDRLKHGIWFNSDRNDIIADCALRVPRDEQKLFLTRTVYHAAEIYRRLKDHMDISLVYDSVDAVRYASLVRQGVLSADVPRMTPSLKNKYLARFESGVGSYVATVTWEVGIDPTYLQHLFVVDSFSSEIKASQGPTRASRINSSSGKVCGYVHDFRDKFDDGFYNASRSRQRVYAGHGWSQVLLRGDSVISL